MAYELTAKEKLQIRQNSIERVINTTITLVEALEKEELAAINYEDWTELKWIVCKLWDRERNEIFKELEAEAQAKEAKD